MASDVVVIGGSGQSRRYRPRPLSVLRRFVLWGRSLVLGARGWYLRRVLKMDLSPKCRFSLKANFDRTNPRGVHVGEGSYVAFGAVILTHDMSRLFHTDTYIGRNCFIGAHSIIMPGVRVGDQCIVGAGAVVTRDVPPQSIVGGNPATVIRSGIQTREWGILEDAFRAAVSADEAAAAKRQG